MALVVKDRVRETTTTSGTGTVTLAGAVVGFQSFSVIGDGNTTYYAIVDPTTGDWEVGIGTYTASGTSLSRTTILESSNSGSVVNFSANLKDVFVTYPAEKAVYADVSDVVNVTTLDTTNIEVTNLKAKDGTAAATIADSTGIVSFGTTGAVKVPSGTTAQQPTAVAGMVRFNTDTSEFEGYNGSAWASIGGSAISNDTSTSTDIYPLSAAATSGTALTVYTSNAKLLYKPSTGEFKADVPVASNGIFVNNTTIDASYTIASGSNGFSVGPVSVASGATITVSSGQRWVVI